MKMKWINQPLLTCMKLLHVQWMFCIENCQVIYHFCFCAENQVMSDGEQIPEDVDHIPLPPTRSVKFWLQPIKICLTKCRSLNVQNIFSAKVSFYNVYKYRHFIPVCFETITKRGIILSILYVFRWRFFFSLQTKKQSWRHTDRQTHKGRGWTLFFPVASRSRTISSWPIGMGVSNTSQ